MLKKKNGFSMIEVLFASSLFFQSFLLVIPIYSNIQASTEILTEKRWAAVKLHDELQHWILNESTIAPKQFESEENDTIYHFQFTKEDSYMKGCVEWNNAKESKEIICLHGLSQK